MRASPKPISVQQIPDLESVHVIHFVSPPRKAASPSLKRLFVLCKGTHGQKIVDRDYTSFLRPAARSEPLNHQQSRESARCPLAARHLWTGGRTFRG